MALTSGTRLGPYEIQAPLGAGGMGEVYRAKDTRLDRTVAVKILPTHLSADSEFKQRFEREARTVSSLNHPHICHLYDVGSQDGTDFLVMEFLDGETLAERLRRGALPFPELLKIGIEVAEALEIAHRTGIVHRDFKPGNIMLSKSGTKLMDFGLAKPNSLGAAGSGSAPLLSAARTMSGATPISPLTTAGSIVGTVQYMSPEQIEGKEADARADIFAFGAVLYEMAMGKRAFEGKSQISVASAILEKDPEPVSASKPSTPPAFDYLVAACLTKDREDRFQSAHDVRLQLKAISQSPQAPAAVTAAQPPRMFLLRALLAGAALLLFAAALLFYLSQRASKPALSVRAYIPPPLQTTFRASGFDAGPVVVSPDGKTLAFSAVDDKGHTNLWLRPLDAQQATMLPSTDDAACEILGGDGTIAHESNPRYRATSGRPSTRFDGIPSLQLCQPIVRKLPASSDHWISFRQQHYVRCDTAGGGSLCLWKSVCFVFHRSDKRDEAKHAGHQQYAIASDAHYCRHRRPWNGECDGEHPKRQLGRFRMLQRGHQWSARPDDNLARAKTVQGGAPAAVEASAV
ncbi:MAG: serine/threonine-protein kinase [Candidatus Sulfotelmatobacter sp.]